MTPRRTRHKVDELGLTELVTELLTRGHTYEEIAAECERQGHPIGKSSIHRFNQTFQRNAERIAQTAECARALAQVVKDQTGQEPDLDMTDMLLAVLQHSLMEKVSGEELTIKDITNLAFAGSTVAKSKVSVEKARADERKRALLAFDRAAAELKQILSQTDLWNQVQQTLTQHRRTLET